MNIKIEPRKMTDRGGYLMLPLVKNIPYPANDTWKKSTCPKCGAECWDRQLPPGFTEDMFSGKMCTECALRTRKGRNDNSQSKDTDCKHGRGHQRSQTGYLQSGVRRVPDERNRNHSRGAGRVRNHGRGGKF